VGPTVRELQEEYGGAGNFYIPIEEHYILDEEEWRYDKWPEFFNGKNVADFYDADIEQKLKALEEEEDQLIRMEFEENELMEDEVDEDGVTKEELKKALKEVRGKKVILKLQHKLKKNLRARSRNKKLSALEEHLEKKGIDANIESIKARSKSRRTIGDLEEAQEKNMKKTFARDSDDEDDEELVDDDNVRMQEGERRGRKRQRDADDYMEVDQVGGDSTGKGGKTARSFTPK
jgi:nucleolar GTP-binding protein